MRKLLLAIAAFMLLASVGCNRNSNSESDSFPANFSGMSDNERMAYMMRHADPDSVAQFLCNAFLGRVPGAKIDTLAIAYLYAIENYRGEDADKFSMAFEQIMRELPLGDKMHTQFSLGLADTLSVGYDLGLGYVSQIRRRNMKPDEIDADIAAFRETCGRDTATYNRFVRGFKTALTEDKGKDLSDDIYRRYIGMQEILSDSLKRLRMGAVTTESK